MKDLEVKQSLFFATEERSTHFLQYIFLMLKKKLHSNYLNKM